MSTLCACLSPYVFLEFPHEVDIPLKATIKLWQYHHCMDHVGYRYFIIKQRNVQREKCGELSY